MDKKSVCGSVNGLTSGSSVTTGRSSVATGVINGGVLVGELDIARACIGSSSKLISTDDSIVIIIMYVIILYEYSESIRTHPNRI